MPTATLTSKGQVTIPKAIRERLGLEAGDLLEFSVDDEGRVVVRSGREREDLFGLLREFAPERPVSTDAMSAAVRRRSARRHRAAVR